MSAATDTKDTTTATTRQFRLLEPIPEYFGHRIRVLVDEMNDNAPWFVAVDVCEALGLGRNRVWNHVHKLDPNDKITNSISESGTRPLLCVNEPGFYELVLGSRKPDAIPFKRWVCSTVLPSIRRHGEYVAYTDENGDPIDVPVEMVSLAKTLPSGNVTEESQRIHVWEFCELRGLQNFGRVPRAALGKIARRLLITYDLPILKRWKAQRLKSIKRDSCGYTGIYPEPILDMAYQQYLDGLRD